MTALFDGGGAFTIRGTSNRIVVPTSINYTGGVEVSKTLAAWIKALPRGSCAVFQENGIYRVNDFPLILDTVLDIELDCNGATFLQTQAAPNRILMVDARVTFEFDPVTNKNCYHLYSNDADFTPIFRSVTSWYVSGDPFPKTVRASKAQFRDAHHITLTQIQPPPDEPILGTGMSVSITGAEDRNRYGIQLKQCQRVVIHDFEIDGSNNAFTPFNPLFEGQHGIAIMAGKDNEIFNGHIHHVWGDGINCSIQGNQLPSYYLHDNDIDHCTRHGLGLTASDYMPDGITYSKVERNNVWDAKRHLIDIEPNSPDSTVQALKIRVNDFRRGGLGFLAISAYNWVDAFVGFVEVDDNYIEDYLSIPVGTNHNRPATQPRWGPFKFRNNFATQAFATGVPFKPDAFYYIPNADPNLYGGWHAVPATIKFLYCDDIEVSGNTMPTQTGRDMWSVAAIWCRQVSVKGVHDNTNAPESNSRQLMLLPPPSAGVEGTALFNGGGAFSATGQLSVDLSGVANFFGGGLFTATGQPGHRGVADFDGGGLFEAIGQSSSLNYGAALFDGGGAFSATGKSGAEVEQEAHVGWRSGPSPLRGPGWDAAPWDDGEWEAGRP